MVGVGLARLGNCGGPERAPGVRIGGGEPGYKLLSADEGPWNSGDGEGVREDADVG